MKKSEFNMLRYCKSKITENNHSSYISLMTLLGYIKKLQEKSLSTATLDGFQKKFNSIDIKHTTNLKLYNDEILDTISTIEIIVEDNNL